MAPVIISKMQEDEFEEHLPQSAIMGWTGWNRTHASIELDELKQLTLSFGQKARYVGCLINLKANVSSEFSITSSKAFNGRLATEAVCYNPKTKHFHGWQMLRSPQTEGRDYSKIKTGITLGQGEDYYLDFEEHLHFWGMKLKPALRPNPYLFTLSGPHTFILDEKGILYIDLSLKSVREHRKGFGMQTLDYRLKKEATDKVQAFEVAPDAVYLVHKTKLHTSLTKFRRLGQTEEKSITLHSSADATFQTIKRHEEQLYVARLITPSKPQIVTGYCNIGLAIYSTKDLVILQDFQCSSCSVFPRHLQTRLPKALPKWTKHKGTSYLDFHTNAMEPTAKAEYHKSELFAQLEKRRLSEYTRFQTQLSEIIVFRYGKTASTFTKIVVLLDYFANLHLLVCQQNKISLTDSYKLPLYHFDGFRLLVRHDQQSLALFGALGETAILRITLRDLPI